jgi:hypothetical protein
MTICSRIARGFVFGGSTAFAAEVSPKAGFGFRARRAASRLEDLEYFRGYRILEGLPVGLPDRREAIDVSIWKQALALGPQKRKSILAARILRVL